MHVLVFCFSGRNLGALFEVLCVGLSIMNLKLFDAYRIINSRILTMTLEYLMTHKYRGSIVVLSISKSVEPNEERKEMASGFQQGNVCKH